MTRRTWWAEFETGQAVLAAARDLRAQGFSLLDAFTPYPLPELEEALGLKRPQRLLALVLAAACAGAGLSFLLMWWTAARSYPLDVGGRPLNSFVADIPILFESAVLSAAVTAFFGTLFTSGMPRLHHPLEVVPGFQQTSIDRFWLGVTEHDPSDLNQALPYALERLGARQIHRIEGSGACDTRT